MHIELNGAPREIPDDTDIAGLLALLELTGRRLAVEVNREIIPRGRHAGHQLSSGDRVEVVQAIGGGATA
ncbi:MAG: sulfur carrier protein ThiS [Gammaproteobacteria bacterium]|jgi:sulfur carrier protein|nr:MAG: sulfur carrier protein ThiS [Gammaproteobacteria bacterium]